MLKQAIFTYFTLRGVISQVNEYSEDNLDGLTHETTYYKDSTSTYRTPEWMKNAPYDQLLTTGIQNSGTWNAHHSAISLGNGKLINTAVNNAPDGSSSQAAVEFINSVKNYYTALQGTETPFPNPLTGSNSTYDHIQNFWYRDGDLFALILDDNANDMIHNNDYRNKQSDVIIDNLGNGQFKYKVRPEPHHMEHLRKYCNYMGGDLWTPASQAEYDDIMERTNGVCDQHSQVFQDGRPWKGVNDKTEIYLNLHREGYLGCPKDNIGQQKYKIQEQNGAGLETELACPDQYGSNPGGIPNRELVPPENFYLLL